MTKICEYCKCVFDTTRRDARYCSIQCSGMALRKRNFLKREARARELGITVEELIRRIKRGRVGLRDSMPKRYKIKRPKSYAEIRAANRRHPIAAGWRGAPVMGGGVARHNDPWLKPSEYVR